MEPGSKYSPIITRYLLNEADEEEEKFVLDWMNADDKNRLYVESLRKTLQLTDLAHRKEELDVEKEWKQLKERLAGSGKIEAELAPMEMPVSNSTNEGLPGSAKIYRILASCAAAAVVAVFVLFVWKPFQGRVDAGKAVTTRLQEVNKVKIDSAMAVVHHEVNVSGRIIRFGLPDGSQIALANNSEITYKEPVNSHRRDVYLKGKADFSVAKDKSKPFTVYGGDIATTAIGTRFTVAAVEGESYTSVKLHEGRVVIKSANIYNSKWLKDFYLMPGQELVYDNRKKTASLRSDTRPQPKNTMDKAAKDDPAVPHYNHRSWFMFNNQSLPEVLDALAGMYHVKIVYTKKEIKDRYFIGTFDRTEPLKEVLNRIAMLNSLSVTNLKDTFLIKAQH